MRYIELDKNFCMIKELTEIDKNKLKTLICADSCTYQYRDAYLLMLSSYVCAKPKVHMIDANGMILASFATIYEAEAQTGIDIHRIRSNMYDDTKYCSFYRFMTDKKRKGALQVKRINQYTKNGKLVCAYNNIKYAQMATNISYGSITSCLKGYSNTAGGYIWAYEDEDLM